MACKGQIESHIYYVMEARNLMRDADTAGLLRSRRLELLNDALNLVNIAATGIGFTQELKALRTEITDKFLEAADHGESILEV